jgi:hypothetical protein
VQISTTAPASRSGRPRRGARWRYRGWTSGLWPPAGIELTDEVEQPHLGPWATVLKAPTTRDPVWLKAAGPGTAFEVGLYEILQRDAPDHVLTPVATDVTQAGSCFWTAACRLESAFLRST